MGTFFTRERFGRPQFFAGALLLAFLAQAVWLVRSELRVAELHEANGPDASEQARIAAGWRQLHGGGIARSACIPMPSSRLALPMEISEDQGFDTEHSPLLSLVTAAPLLAWPQRLLESNASAYWRWLPRIPFLAFGAFLGASLWYVARRLCGNTGGFIALTLYCFSPSMIQASAVWHTEPEILAAWGSFGDIFTAIAVAHTLYAPREVVLWNWRRIVLLGISLAIAVGSQFSMVIVVPLALAFLLYLAPIRRGAAFAIWATSCLVALVMLFAVYFFQVHAFAEGNLPHHVVAKGSDLAQLHRPRRLPAGLAADFARLSCACPAAAGRDRDIHCMASDAVLRQYGSWPGRPAIHWTGHGTSSRGRCGIPAGFAAFLAHLCLRHSRRPHGNVVSPGCDRECLGASRSLYPVESVGLVPCPPRLMLRSHPG